MTERVAPKQPQNDVDRGPESGIKVPTPIDMSGGINGVVLTHLKDIAKRCQATANIHQEEEIKWMMMEYRQLISDYFFRHDLIKDPRVAGILRFIDFCFKLDFELSPAFYAAFLKDDPEESIRLFKELIRCTILILEEEIGSIGLTLRLKLPSIRRENTWIWEIARQIAEKAYNQTLGKKEGTTDELLSLMVLFNECFKS